MTTGGGALMLRRTKEKVTENHIGDELQQGIDHLRSAASIAAGIAAERLAPAMEQARDRMAPRVEQARAAAAQAWEQRMRAAAGNSAGSAMKMSRRARRKAQKPSMGMGRRGGGRLRTGAVTIRMEQPKQRRWRWMMGAIGIGAAVGAVGALISRRSRSEWEEYESRTGATGGAPMAGAGAHSKSTREKVTDMADAAKRKASEAMNTVRDRSGKSSANDAARPAREMAADPNQRMSGSSTSEPAVTGTNVRPGHEDRPPMT
ncbi:MAG: hypothetical protein ACRDUA_06760 [Micromonosporaceae bacterium]